MAQTQQWMKDLAVKIVREVYGPYLATVNDDHKQMAIEPIEKLIAAHALSVGEEPKRIAGKIAEICDKHFDKGMQEFEGDYGPIKALCGCLVRPLPAAPGAAHPTAQRDNDHKRIEFLRTALRKAVVELGGMTTEDVSDEFLDSVAEGIRNLRSERDEHVSELVAAAKVSDAAMSMIVGPDEYPRKELRAALSHFQEGHHE